MASSTSRYDISTYLLDRANIEDTVRRLWASYDLHDAPGLADHVFAPEISIDYTAIFGGQVTHHTGKQWAESVIDICKAMSAHQHVTSTLLADLPQPGPSATRPGTCAASSAVSVTNVRYEARGGPLMQNGGRCEYELVRIPELEERGLNPWRVSLMRVALAWEKGSTDVFTPLEPLMAKAVEGRLR